MRHLALCAALLVAPRLTSAPPLQRLVRPDRPGTAWTVQAPDTPLVFTGQIGDPRRADTARGQAAGALAALERVLVDSASGLDRVLRLNAYVTDDADVAGVEAVVAERFAAAPPAFTLVRTPLGAAGARVAFEAVGASDMSVGAVAVRPGDAAILPAGGKLFISGQAERGAEVASAVRLTMAGLHRTLAHLGLGKQEVVQVKMFLSAVADSAAVREVAASFEGAPVPPLVLIEWVSPLFVEIELVASARALPGPAGDKVAYLALPWLPTSPRFSRVCHVGAGVPLIFVGAIDGDGVSGGRGQMKAIFERLGSVLFESGSSYRKLIKATYYLGDPAARAVLGDIRGVYFDPARAPAASALEVRSLGRAGRTAQIDVIAYPEK